MNENKEFISASLRIVRSENCVSNASPTFTDDGESFFKLLTIAGVLNFLWRQRSFSILWACAWTKCEHLFIYTHVTSVNKVVVFETSHCSLKQIRLAFPQNSWRYRSIGLSKDSVLRYDWLEMITSLFYSSRPPLPQKRENSCEFEPILLQRETFPPPDWVKTCGALRRGPLHFWEVVPFLLSMC